MERNRSGAGSPLATFGTDLARLQGNHPDLANPPVYPVALAALMKTLPFKYEINLTDRFWSVPPAPIPDNVREKIKNEEDLKRLMQRQFMRYQPDFLISLFNQLLFFAVVVMFYFLARRLFDQSVAGLATVLLIGCELMWRFTMSGLSTQLLLLLFMGLAWGMVLLEEETNAPQRGVKYQFLLAVGIGLLAGLGCLTRYSYGWIIVPTVLCLALFIPKQRAALCLTVLGVFGLIVLPWLFRNYSLSGLPFGTATVAPIEATYVFPGYRLERSLDPDWTKWISNWTSGLSALMPLIHKLLNGLRQIALTDLVRLGGGWASSFFLVGLLLNFRNRAPRRLRVFLVITLGCLMVVQALSRTQISDDIPDVNSENLIVVLYPLVLLFGVGLFFTLLEQINFIHSLFRSLVVFAFAFIMCLPLMTVFLPPRINPLVYPPYYPPAIRQTAGFMKENELMMGDIPWAVAWYGNRQCIWLTLDAQEQFFAVNDALKPIRGLYLTPLTMDSRFLTEWVRPGEHSWGSFILETMTRREIPPTFPLRKAPSGYLPEQLFLTDWERWKVAPEGGANAPATQ
jgi:4-amino-4-deoxy-L-arabinose transferase-like glycosyltransferase